MQCLDFGYFNSSCTDKDGDWVVEKLREANWIYNELGFKEPSLSKMITKKDCGLTNYNCNMGYQEVEGDAYQNIYIVPTSHRSCNNNSPALYSPGTQTIYYCKGTEEPEFGVDPVEFRENKIRHEYFHAIQNIYVSGTMNKEIYGK